MDEMQDQNGQFEMQIERDPLENRQWIMDVPPHLRPLLNQLIGNLKSFYASLVKKGLYLPEQSSRTINGEYLWKVFTEQVYCPLRSQIKIGATIEKVSKVDLLEQIEQELAGKSLGIDEEHLPEKQWMINVLFTLNPNHKMFTYTNSLSQQQQQQEKQLKQLLSGLDFTLAKGTRRSSLFKINKKAREKMILEKKRLSLQRAKRSRKRLAMRMQKAQQKIDKEHQEINQLEEEKQYEEEED